jgi:diguanylate cyclase (GGDEF)-like protein
MARQSRTAAPSGRTILCVDDQTEFLESMRILLEREGHRVLTAEGGAAGLAVLETESVDLLLLDYLMPGMAADDVIASIRDPGLQIVLLTGYASEKPPREMLDRLDIQGYCDKSRGPEEVLLWVSVALRHSTSIRKLNAMALGLRKVLAACLRPEERLSLETELGNLLAEACQVLELESAFVALAPPPPAQIPPSRLEEESSFPGISGPEEMAMAAYHGRHDRPDSLLDLFNRDQADSILDLGRDEGGILASGAAVVPLRAEGQWIGCLWANPGPVPESPEDELLRFFCGQIANRSLVRQGATIDSVTGLQSRQFWRQLAVRELRQSFRFRHPTGLVRIAFTGLDDLRFQSPRLAEAVLERGGRLLRNTVRGTDLAGRGDHDELLLLLSHSSLVDTAQLARLLSHRMEELEPPPGATAECMEFTLGISSLEPHAYPPESLPRPMPLDYYSLALSLLQARAASSPMPRLDESSSPFEPQYEVDWPDPREVAAARLSRSNFAP